MDYSPKLKEAIKEMRDIAKKYDIAAFIVLHTPDYSGYLNHLDTSYSCLKVEKGGVRVHLSEREVGIDRAQVLAEQSYNLVSLFSEVIGHHALMYIEMQKLMEETWDCKAEPTKHTPHDELN